MHLHGDDAVRASETLHWDRHTLGFLMAATVLGALAGAFGWKRGGSVLGLGRELVVMATVFALRAVFPRANEWLFVKLLVAVGFAMLAPARHQQHRDRQ